MHWLIHCFKYGHICALIISCGLCQLMRCCPTCATKPNDLPSRTTVVYDDQDKNVALIQRFTTSTSIKK